MDSRPPLVSRILDLSSLVARKSDFLFGPRQIGKSALVRHALPKARVYDLLDSSIYLDLSLNPRRLEQELPPGDVYRSRALLLSRLHLR